MLTDPPQARRLVLALLIVACITRLAWGLALPATPSALERLPDQVGYLDMARSLLDGQGLKWNDPRFDQDTYAVRMPGYPLFVALLGGHVYAVRIAQAIIDTSTILAIFLLARRWLHPWLSLFAATLVAFNPFLVYFSALILTETLFTALLAWAAVLLMAPISFIWGGLLLALSVHVRPSAIALPVVVAIVAVLANRQPHRHGRWWPPPVGASMLLMTLLVLLPWAWRNYAVLGRWIWTTTNTGFVTFDGFHDDATGASDQSFISSLEWSPRLQALDEVQRNEVLQRTARHWIIQTWRDEPEQLMRLTLAKIARTWGPIPLSDEFGRPIYRIAALLYAIPFYLLVVLGVWAGGPQRVIKLFLLTPAIYFTAVHALSVGSLRYRIPVEPLLAILAASGLQVLMAALRQPVWKRGTEGG